MELTAFFRQHPKAALGFSGGVDSVYLLYAARQAGAQVQPYFVQTPFQPEFELADARRAAKELDAELRIVPLDHLTVRQVADNPPDRCYHCKRAMFTAVANRAAADGYRLLLDGTNASDDAADRPGMAALNELGVRSPLRECGITKEEVRRLSKEAGLFTWNKPAYACLATRIPTGTPITREVLKRVEGAEDVLFRLGFSDVRVRVCREGARIELPVCHMAAAVERRTELLDGVGRYFDRVLLDLKGR